MFFVSFFLRVDSPQALNPYIYNTSCVFTLCGRERSMSGAALLHPMGFLSLKINAFAILNVYLTRRNVYT